MLGGKFGAAVKSQRRSLGITQPHLAELSGVSVNWLSAFERGQGNPTIATLERIIEVLGMELRLQVKKSSAES